LSGGIYAVRGFKKMPGRISDEEDEIVTRAMYVATPYGVGESPEDVLCFNATWVKKVARDVYESSQVGGIPIAIKVPPGTDTIVFALDND
jgi:hypothetical protein